MDTQTFSLIFIIFICFISILPLFKFIKFFNKWERLLLVEYILDISLLVITFILVIGSIIYYVMIADPKNLMLFDYIVIIFWILFVPLIWAYFRSKLYNHFKLEKNAFSSLQWIMYIYIFLPISFFIGQIILIFLFR